MSLTYQGKRIRKSTEVFEKKLAEKIYAKVVTQIAEGKWFEVSPSQGKSLKELLTKYLNEHSLYNKSVESHKRDKVLARHILQYFFAKKKSEILSNVG